MGASINDTTAPIRIVERWLSRLNSALDEQNADAFANCFALDGWFRDLLTFSWDFKSIQGREAIKSYVAGALSTIRASNVSVDNEFTPCHANFGPTTVLIDAALNFETPRAIGKGFVRIRINADDQPEAFAFMMMVSDWKGHEELQLNTLRPNHFATRTTDLWSESVQERRTKIESSPNVIICERSRNATFSY